MVTGSSHSSSALNPSYSVFGFLGIIDTLEWAMGSGIAPGIIALFLGWLISLILIIGGGISMFMSSKRYKGLLVAGSILLAIVALLWFFWMNAYLEQVGYAAGPATNALISGIACIVTVVCVFMGKKA